MGYIDHINLPTPLEEVDPRAICKYESARRVRALASSNNERSADVIDLID